jgi:hypothetical protein
MKWLEELKLEGLYQEVLDGYLVELRHLIDTIDRYDKRIEELSQGDSYQEPVNKDLLNNYCLIMQYVV